MRYNNQTGLLSRNPLTCFPYLDTYSICWGQIVTAIVFLTACIILYWKPSDGILAQHVGYRSLWEPPLLVQIRYTTRASSMINEGYAKWKDSMYKISRYDGDLVVLSRKYLDDLQNRPPEKLSAIHGLAKNFGGRYSGINLLIESDVGTRALQAKITPNLVKLCDFMRDELEYSLSADLPPCKEWTPVPIQPFLLKALGRMTNRIFVGLPLCRDSKWMETICEHAHNVTMTQIAMRSVPSLMQPLLNLFLPSSWRYKASIREAKRIMIPEVQRRRQLENYDSDDARQPNDLLQAMIDMTSPADKTGQPEDLAHRMLIMTAVAGHSTAAAGAHVLFDLIANPEYVDVLREEALQILHSNGMRLTKQALSQLVKLDSFIRESVRSNIQCIVGFHRLVTAPAGIELYDGTHIPQGTHLCVAPYSISRDPAIVANGDSFDGLRYYEKRRKGTGESTKYQFATVDKTHLHFGYGTWSCPGRFLASDELKMLLATLLIRYDFQYPEGTTRPANGVIHEFPYFTVSATLLVKRRDE
ncbi:P450 monooxygenase [Biscogniauxia sp. FL1348]|nr:P450 monooxygenase [Biscogniauxia sp. FL1348]